MLLPACGGDVADEECGFVTGPEGRGAPLGLEKSVVSLSRYDPSWAVLGEKERTTVQGLLGELATDVQHGGSTAVAGLDAKPILDIAVALAPDCRATNEIVKRMEANGYEYRATKDRTAACYSCAPSASFAQSTCTWLPSMTLNGIATSASATTCAPRLNAETTTNGSSANSQPAMRLTAARTPSPRQPSSSKLFGLPAIRRHAPTVSDGVARCPHPDTCAVRSSR